MRTCILNHDWNNLTKLLILFFDAKKQNPIKYRVSIDNIVYIIISLVGFSEIRKIVEFDSLKILSKSKFFF